jgi:outer membrane protein assembly factor BamD (BamD/ComL family)
MPRKLTLTHVVLVFCLMLALAGCAPKSADELFAKATKALESGQIDSALKLYTQLTDKFPDSPLSFKAKFMSSFLSADSTQKSLSSAEEAYQEYFFNQAQQLQIDGKFEEAVTYYEKFLKEFPASKHAYKAQFMIGFIYNESLKDATRARQAFQKVISAYPNNDLTDDAQWMMENLDKGPEDVIIGQGKK